jgi:hypothetical protein
LVKGTSAQATKKRKVTPVTFPNTPFAIKMIDKVNPFAISGVLGTQRNPYRWQL